MEKEIQIEKIVNQGAGLGYDETGKVVFVACTAVGDIAEVEIVKSKKSYSVGKLKKLIKKSPERIDALCPHFGVCGGCSFQHVKYETELDIKKDIAEGIVKNGISQIFYFEKDYRYRNKVSFHSTYRSGKHQLGFNMLSTNRVVPIDYCYITSKNINSVKSAIERCNINNIEKVDIRESRDSKSILVNILGDKKNLTKDTKILLKSLISEIKSDNKLELVNLALWINSTFIEGIPVKKRRFITADINKIKYLLGPDDFFQVNYNVSEMMFNKIKEYVVTNKIKKIVDGYCGNFAIGMQLLDTVDEITGIEDNRFSVSMATKILKENNILESRAKLVKEDFTKYIKNIQEQSFADAVLIIDPPRTGLEKDAAEAINKMDFSAVIYVSCDIMTAKRDIDIMESYKIANHYLYDMFPRTAHFENLIILER